MPKLFEKILVANRGEVALRIIRACHELGIRTVAVHSVADTDALHVKLASESVCIGPALSRDSYLNITSVMSAAVATGAEAIHPGYGFLSENAAFAEICGSCGITFIGPSVRAMRSMGDKARARRLAEKVGVPTIAGDSRGYVDVVEAEKVAKNTGFPILLKACAGGGGRGMKIVNQAENFRDAFQTASAEVEAAFGDGSLLVERYLPRVRHVEVQIAGDRFHNIVHLGSRDCSIQRRYQKLLEESPPPFIDQSVINQLQDAAIELGRAVNYSSVGTVEFLVDLDSKKFYFIEMNTRLQVEHPVTEMATDTDIVKEQIRIAAGYELSYSQEEVRVSGHTMEVRINAEDPKSLLPSPGLIRGYHAPGGHGTRVDSALYSQYTVQPYYDSLISKLIVRARTREECIEKMIVALDEYIIEGIKTNIELHKRILKHPDFRSGKFHTKFLDNVDLFSEDSKCKSGEPMESSSARA
ncbi:MAG: acetyl-CoA carboxylase biotin carboxylase subunit [Bdellovibrionales bacterium]|nr:acetyl-CoA carboxylase biotin carboxylase subunit [Bdellovibrionales bacterium]